jgi:hypothetical protein
LVPAAIASDLHARSLQRADGTKANGALASERLI